MLRFIINSAVNMRCVLAGLMALLLFTGCARSPVWVSESARVPIDRSAVEYPTGFELMTVIRGLTSPTAIAFDEEGSLLIAEGGIGGTRPRIFGYRQDGAAFNIYPTRRRLPLGLQGRGFMMQGPVGGMLAHQGRVYVSHRDAQGKGVITSFDYRGMPTTVVADLPAQGDHGVTDLAMGPNGRLYFGVGTATNSGVVGIDNWLAGWVRRYPRVADQPAVEMKLLGYRFDTPNPRGGVFGGDDISVTAPFQPFGRSNQTRVPPAANNKPNGAIYSVNPQGGDLRVEAHGVRHPVGLGFNEFGRLYMTNQGMQLRGTRPVKDDPDVILRMIPGTWYGWPDFSADLRPVSDPRYHPPADMLVRTGYPELSFLIDHRASGPNGLPYPERSTLLNAVFPSLSGAAKIAFVPATGPFNEFAGQAVVALSGDRAPFATSNVSLIGPIGFKLVMVDVDMAMVRDFVQNTQEGPASRNSSRHKGIERPVDVKFAPDGSLYILDLGRLENITGRETISPGTGRVLRLSPIDQNNRQ